MYEIHTLIHFWLREASENHENLTNLPYQNQTDQPFSAFLSVDDITMRTLTFLVPLTYSIVRNGSYILNGELQNPPWLRNHASTQTK